MFLYLFLQSQKCEDLRGSAVGLLNLLVHAAHPFYRLVCLEQGIDEGAERTDGHQAMLNFLTRVKQNDGDHHGAQNVHKGPADYKSAYPAHVFMQQLPGALAELGDLETLHAKGLHHAISAQRLLENLAQFAKM